MRSPNFVADCEEEARDLRLTLPAVVGACDTLSEKVLADSESLLERDTHLIALAIAVASRCDGSVRKRLSLALEAGVQPREIVHCLGVTILMGGEVAEEYAAQVLGFLEE